MDLASILEVLIWLVPLVLVFGVSLGIYYFSLLSYKSKYLLLYLGICLIVDLLSRIFAGYYGNNLALLIVFSFLELVCFYSFFRHQYFKRRVVKHIVLTSLALVYMIVEVFIMYRIPALEFQSYSKTLGSFVILLMVIDFLFELLRNKQLDYSVLRANSIFMFYFSINMIFFLPINFLINVPSEIKFYLWCVNFIVTILFYLFIVWEIWRNGLKQKQLQLG